jgi:hypothetical protein
MAKANLGGYNYNPGQNDKDKSKGNTLNQSNWESDDKTTQTGTLAAGPSDWDNYYDPYAATLLGQTDTPADAKINNTLDDTGINRLKGKEIEAYGIRDYDAYGPLNRLIRWGTSGLTKQSEQDYYDEQLKNTRSEDERKMIKDAEFLGMKVPEGDLWADGEQIYNEFSENLEAEKKFYDWKQENEDYQKLSEFEKPQVTPKPYELYGEVQDFSGPDIWKQGELGRVFEATYGRKLSDVKAGDLFKIEGQTFGVVDGELQEVDQAHIDKVKAGAGGLDYRLNWDLKDLTRDNYETEFAKILTGYEDWEDEQ